MSIKPTVEEMLETCKKLYAKHGFEGLTFDALTEAKIYTRLYNRGIKGPEIRKHLQLSEEAYQEYRDSSWSRTALGVEQIRWTRAKMFETLQKVVDELNELPPLTWFRENGYGSLVTSLYSHDIQWPELRDHFKSYDMETFTESKNGIRWSSRPEAYLSNFLAQHDIKHGVGRSYTLEDTSARTRKFDLWFEDENKQIIDVDVMGGGRCVRQESAEERLNKKRVQNVNREQYFEILHNECYNNNTLTQIFSAYFETLTPRVEPIEKVTEVQTRRWKDKDELLKFCAWISEQQPDKRLPNEDWFRKRRKHANRPGDTYNEAAIAISRTLGGIAKVRKLLGQEQGRICWPADENAFLRECQTWIEKHGNLPNAIIIQHKNGSQPQADVVLRSARSLMSQFTKRFGSQALAKVQVESYIQQQQLKQSAISSTSPSAFKKL